jgi:acyl-coenzyme A thioesterase PaaI-like protein
MQGGAQGMMMEMVGKSLAHALLKTDHVQLVAIQVDFQSSGKQGEVEVIAQEIHHDVAMAQVVVHMVDRTTGRIISTGNLRFAATTAAIDDNNNLPEQRSGPIMSRI